MYCYFKINIFKFLSINFNMINIDRYEEHTQKLFGFLNKKKSEDQKFECSCISFLLLLQQISTNLVASYRSGGPKSKIGLIGLKLRQLPSGGSRKKSVPCFFQLLEAAHVSQLLAISLWPLLPSLHLPFWLWHTYLPLIRTLEITLGPSRYYKIISLTQEP